MLASFCVTIFYILAGLGLIVAGFRLFSEFMQLITGSWLRAIHRWMSCRGHGLFKSMLMGLVASFFIQSSRLSSFMAFSFASSGLFSVNQLSGFLLGASLGTVPVIGLFFLDFSLYGLPMLALGVFSLTHSRYKFYWVKILFSVGVMLLGYYLFDLGFDQRINGERVTDLFKLFIQLSFGFFWLSEIPLFIYALIASVFIQSRLALVVLAVPLVAYDFLSLQASLVFVLGVNMGAALKLSFSAFRGSVVWRRVALFYFFTTVLGVLLSYFLIIANVSSDS